MKKDILKNSHTFRYA